MSLDIKEPGSVEQAVGGNNAQASKKSQSVQALQDITFGSIAGIVGKYIEYPFDTVKVRLQSQPVGRPQYTGPLDCFGQSIRRDGFWSLYRGISAPLVGAAIENSSLFFSYRLAQDAMRFTVYGYDTASLPMGALATAGAASGAFTSLLLTPIELIKCKMQVPLQEGGKTIHSPGPIQLIGSVFRHQGVLGFWRGQLGTLIRETGGSAAWFGSFEGVSLYFRNRRSSEIIRETPLPIWQQLLAGATAGMTYNFAFYPADTIKSRMQTEEIGLNAAKSQNTFWTVGKALWRDQGLKGLYRGCGITVGRAAPSSAFIFTTYEWLKHHFG